MKILHVVPSYYPATYWGGPIFSVYALNNTLARLPYVELKVLTTDSSGPAVTDRLNEARLDQSHYPNQEVIFTRRIAGADASIGLLKRSPALIRWADVVHLTATYSFPTIPVLLMCRLFRKMLVWSPRGAILDASEWDGARRKGLKRIWEHVCNKIIQRGTVTLHVTSLAEKETSLARIPKASAVVIRNGVNIPHDLPQRNWLPSGMMRLLFLGRLSPKKGIENLLDAMKILDDDSIFLRIYGTGDRKYADCLKQRAKEAGLLGKGVDFAGHVDGDAKRAGLIDADVCVIPSFSENFAMVVAEALASGLPVIVSRNLPQWADVESRNCGLWVENDSASLAAAIRKSRTMDLSAMGRNGRQWMKEEFGWEEVAKEMHIVYGTLVQKR